MDALAVSSLLNVLALPRALAPSATVTGSAITGGTITGSTMAAAAGASILDQLFARSPPSAAMPQPPSPPGTGLPLAGTARPLPLEALPPRALEAVVLSSTLLAGSAQGRPVAQIPPELLAGLPPAPRPPAAGAPHSGVPPQVPLFRTAIRVGSQRFDFLSPVALPTRAVVLVAVSAQGLQLQSIKGVSDAPRSEAGRHLASASPAFPAIQQARRETLPIQQPLHVSMNRLQEIAGHPQVPRAVAEAAQQLLRQLPAPPQLAQPAGLRAALIGSGATTEARLAQALRPAVAPPAPGDVSPAATDGAPVRPTRDSSVAAVLSDDRRALLGSLLAVLRPLLPTPGGAAMAGGPAAAPAAGSLLPPEPEPALPGPATLGAPGAASNESSDSDSGDAAELGALQRLLQSAIARLQHHQLESVMTRQPAADGTPQLPTWLFELPIQTPRGIDQLQLRFEQQREPGTDPEGRRLWQVRLDFDLHDLGRFSAVLQAGGNGVAATLWSELEQTHRLVRDEVAVLREKLANAGVTVNDVVCRQGLPGAPVPAVSSRLIDLHT